MGSWELVEPVGSATTLLIELMRKADIKLDAIEATLLTLGIYTDTGTLTYAGVGQSPRVGVDAQCQQGRLDGIEFDVGLAHQLDKQRRGAAHGLDKFPAAHEVVR